MTQLAKKNYSTLRPSVTIKHQKENINREGEQSIDFTISASSIPRRLRAQLSRNTTKPTQRHVRSANYMDRVKRIWYLSPMRAAKVQTSLRIRAVSPEPSLLAHTSSESRGTFRQKARSLAPLNGWACAVKICHDGMLEDTNSLDGAHIISLGICKVWSFFPVHQKKVWILGYL